MKPIFTTLGLSLLCATASWAQSQTFSTQGNNSFTVPNSVISMKVECVGGGGAGGRVTPSNILDKDAAGGGGGGAYAASIIEVNEGITYTMYVGAGGINDGSSVDGEATYFDDGSQVSADGGSTRSGNDNEPGALGGLASNSIGMVVFSGGTGGNGNEGDADGGGGGGAAGSNGDGFNGSTVTGGGNQANYGGHGGQGGPDGASGADGGQYGGGGGGSSANGSNDRDGGEGASGVVVITWCTVDTFTPQEVCVNNTSDVTITGTNFVDVDSVTLSGEQLTYNVVSPTEITVTLSQQSVSGKLTVHTQNGSAQTADNLEVFNESVSIYISGNNELTAQYSGQSGSFQWVDCANGNAPVSGATGSSAVFSNNGVYAVTVTENGCVLNSDCFVFNSVGLENIKEDDVIVYPNPVAQSLYVENADGIVAYKVFNNVGQLMKEGNLSNGTINMFALESGAYILHLCDKDGGVIFQKSVIKK